MQDDFKIERTNMVDCQIHPAGVIDAAILDAFSFVPRERFVPEDSRKIAYADEDAPLGQGRALLSPMLHAKMVQAVKPLPSDRVLDIGGGTGYSAAILSMLTGRVTALEENDRLSQAARPLWTDLGCRNVTPVAGKLAVGAPAFAPFDIIFFNGAMTSLPGSYAFQLSAGGRLIAILRPPSGGPGRVTLAHRSGTDSFSSHTLFEGGAAYLPGFAPEPAFQF